MRKRIFYLLTIFLTLTAVKFSFAAELVIISMQGSVEVQKKGESQWEKAKTGVIIKSGDKIRTGKKSQAVTVTKEGHKISIKQNTSFLISKLGPVEWEFEQELGKSRFKVAKLSSGQSLRVKTPTALCAVRGTEFEVTVREDKSTILDVFSGMVALADLAGLSAEISVMENQRSVVEEGAAPRMPEAIPEKEREEMQEKGAEKEEGKIQNEFKNEIAREVGFDLNRENIESAAAFELQSAEYQEAKTLIDAFGKRVRLEEYITRPTPDSFKFVSLNTREDRFDFGFFEVVANKALPSDLSAAGNLWFSVGTAKPEFYAVKERWFVSNSKDSIARLHLDGDSQQITFTEPIFAENGEFISLPNQSGWQTVFNHKYEFINGNPTALEKIWSEASFRPKDNGLLSNIKVTGMMWHMRPVKEDITMPNPLDPLNPTVLGSFYKDVFVTKSETAGDTGKMVVTTFEPDADPFKAHFTETHHYINFQDANGNGRFDAGADTIFSDLNKDGALNASEPSLALTSNFFSVLAFAKENRWAWQTGDNFMIDDFGKVLDFRKVGVGNLAEGGENKNTIADFFEKVNFERVWKSSEFEDPNHTIDVVMTPRIFLQAGLLEPQSSGNQPIDSRK